MTGGRYSELTLHCDKEEAEKTKRKYDSVEKIGKLSEKEVEANSIELISSEFLREKEVKVKVNSYKTYEYLLAHLTQSFSGRQLGEIQPEEYEQWRLAELQAAMSTSTYNSVIKHVSVFLRWAASKDFIAFAPDFNRVTELKNEGWLEAEQINAILEASSPDMRDYFTVLLNTGARVREILKRPWQHWHDGYIEIPASDSNSNKAERLWVNDTVDEILTRRRKTEPVMFDFSYGVVRGAYRKLSNHTGISFNAQDFRKACGYILLQKGIDLYDVSKFLRHKDVKTTENQYASLLSKNYSHLAKILDGI